MVRDYFAILVVVLSATVSVYSSMRLDQLEDMEVQISISVEGDSYPALLHCDSFKPYEQGITVHCVVDNEVD